MKNTLYGTMKKGEANVGSNKSLTTDSSFVTNEEGYDVYIYNDSKGLSN